MIKNHGLVLKSRLVFNFRHGHEFAESFITEKLLNLKWKTLSKQLLGSLPLDFAHTHYPYCCCPLLTLVSWAIL
jgi:hypothetical protein